MKELQINPNTTQRRRGENKRQIHFYGQEITVPVCTLVPPKYLPLSAFLGGEALSADRKTAAFLLRTSHLFLLSACRMLGCGAFCTCSNICVEEKKGRKALLI